MYKYKLVKKINPQDKAAPKKWYAIPISEVPQTVKAMTRAATENTTTAPIEMEAALELLGRHARQQLQQGHTVRVGDLGTIRVSFKSDMNVTIVSSWKLLISATVTLSLSLSSAYPV